MASFKMNLTVDNKTALRICAVIGVTYVTYRVVSQQLHIRRMWAKIEKKLAQRQNTIDVIRRQFVKTSPGIRREIQEMSFNELHDALQTDCNSCVQVLHAYQEAALKAHEKTNCVTEFLIEAEEWAQELDDLAASGDYEKPLLFGIPFSNKESNALQGHDSTLGYPQEIDNPNKVTCNAITILRQRGAYPFVLTNLPQTVLYYACKNPIFGETRNPFDTNRSPGGSSGGEGALLGLRGAPFGLGTDVGGSVRLPAHYCGIATMRPSGMRISQGNNKWATPGRAVVSASIGPMAMDVDAVIAVMHALVDFDTHNRMDKYVVPLKWTPIEGHKRMRIGYFVDTEAFPCDPSTRRAIMEAKDKLYARGHDMVEWQPIDCSHVLGMWISSVRPDGFHYVGGQVEKGIAEESFKWSYNMMKVQPALARFYLSIFGTKQQCEFMSRVTRKTSELRQLFEDIATFRSEMQKKWIAAGLDAVICPVAATPALGHDIVVNTQAAYSYCSMWNLTDYAGGVVKMTNVTKEDQTKCMEEYPTKEYEHRHVRDSLLAPSVVGLPVGVQIVTPPFDEEVCAYVMQELNSK